MLKFVRKGERLKGVVQKTPNVVIQKIQQGTSRNRCFIIGSGYTLNVDEEDRVTWHDPAMIKHEYGILEDITVYTFFYTYECKGLAEAAEEIATFVNTLFKKFDRIFLIGHSKCGLCMCKTTEYLNDLATLVTISTPFDGTIVADKDAVERKVKSKTLMWMYRKIFSDHNVDKDIMPGSEFLKNLKDPVCSEHINLMSKFDDKKVYFSPIDQFLKLVDKVLNLGGDGVVPFSSQMAKTEKCATLGCSHAESLKEGLRMIEEYSRLMR